jgi:hypothetical protein
MYATPSLCDSFACPNNGKDWHREVAEAVTRSWWESSPSIKKLVEKDADDILSKHAKELVNAKQRTSTVHVPVAPPPPYAPPPEETVTISKSEHERLIRMDEIVKATTRSSAS